MCKDIPGHLNVFNVRKGNSDADDGSGVVVGEIEAFTDLPATNGDEERPVDGAIAHGPVRCRFDDLEKVTLIKESGKRTIYSIVDARAFHCK